MTSIISDSSNWSFIGRSSPPQLGHARSASSSVNSRSTIGSNGCGVGPDWERSRRDRSCCSLRRLCSAFALAAASAAAFALAWSASSIFSVSWTSPPLPRSFSISLTLRRESLEQDPVLRLAAPARSGAAPRCLARARDRRRWPRLSLITFAIRNNRFPLDHRRRKRASIEDRRTLDEKRELALS